MSPRENGQVSIIIIYFCVFVLLLNACSSQEPTAAPTPQNTPTSIQISNTDTPTPTQTPRPTYVPSPTPTVDVITALASEYDIPAVCLFAYQISIDRNWIGADCNTSHELLIVQKGTGYKISIPYQDILDKNPVAFTVKPLRWSSNSQYFYFTTATVCCSDFNQYEGNGALYQYDAENGYWDILIKASYKPYYFFSDDGTRYVYIRQSNTLYAEIEIGMVEILTKESKRVVLKGYSVENPEDFAWSKHTDRFVIVLWELQFRNDTPGNVLLEVDFKKMDMQIVEEFNWNNLLGEE